MIILVQTEVMIFPFPLKLRTAVKKVTPVGNDKERRVWSVVTEDVETKKQEELEFDAVMVCNG
jgi:cation diffusion facilitator CzcD-associated flavoprotein CzcO